MDRSLRGGTSSATGLEHRTWLPVVMPVASIKFPVLSPDITSGRPSYKRLLCCDAGDQPEYEY